MSPAATRAALVVAACGAASVCAVVPLLGRWGFELLAGNRIPWSGRLGLLVAMAVASAAACVAAIVLCRRSGEERLIRLSRRLAPLLLLPFMTALLRYPGVIDPLPAIVVISGVVLWLERMLRSTWIERPLPAAEISPRTAAIALSLLVLGYASFMATFSLFRHWRFETFGYDLGQLDNVFWSTLNGRPFQNAPLGLAGAWREFSNHFDPTIAAFLPIYALFPGAETLLVLQSAWIALGMVPLYRFARRRLSPGAALLLAGAYAFYAPLHGANSYDFHMQPMAATFVLAGIDFVDEGRFLPAAIALLLALGCREDVSAGVALLGLFLALSGHRVRFGSALAVFASTYFVAVRFFVMPAFGTWGFANVYGDLRAAGADGFGGIVATVLSNPVYTLSTLVTAEKARYLLQVLAPLAFLPVRRAWLVPSLVPGALFTLFTSQAPMIGMSFQYSALFVPYVFPAAALALAAFGESREGLARRRIALVAVAVGTLLTTAQWGAFPPRLRYRSGFHEVEMRPPTNAHRQKAAELTELLRDVSPQTAIAASERLIPHLSQRLEIYSLRDQHRHAEIVIFAEEEEWDGAARGRKAIASGEFAEVARTPSGLVKAVRRRPSSELQVLERLGVAPGSAPPHPEASPPISPQRER